MMITTTMTIMTIMTIMMITMSMVKADSKKCRRGIIRLQMVARKMQLQKAVLTRMMEIQWNNSTMQ